MRVAMILDGAFPPDPRVENEAISLIQSGHEVFLFCLSYTTDFLNSESIKGIQIRRFYCPPFMRKLMALAYTNGMYHRRLTKMIRHFLSDVNPDVIHAHDLQSARSVFQAKSPHHKVILDLHENRPEIMKYYAHVKNFPGKFLIRPAKWKTFEKLYMKEADRIIVVTESARDYYVNNYGLPAQKFTIVPNTIQPEFYTNYALDSKITDRFKETINLLYLGETGLRRGTLDLVRAMKLILQKEPKVRLIIVGKSKEDQLLIQEVARLGLENHVFFEGWKPFETFQSYLSIASIGYSLLHRNIHHDTTYANKVFQYLSFGVPVVVSDSTAQKLIVEKHQCGLISEAQNIQDIAEKSLQIIQDSALSKLFSENGKNSIQSELNWDMISTDLIRLYGEI